MDTTKDEATAHKHKHKHNNQSSFVLTAHCQFQTTKLSIYVPTLVTSLFYVYIHLLYDMFPNLFVVCLRDKE